jgi:hypothetical protein
MAERAFEEFRLAPFKSPLLEPELANPGRELAGDCDLLRRLADLPLLEDALEDLDLLAELALLTTLPPLLTLA